MVCIIVQINVFMINKDDSYLWKHIENLNCQSSKFKIPDEMCFDGSV